jgi:hypothetical protein
MWHPGSDSLSGLYCLKCNPIGIKSYPALALLSLGSAYAFYPDKAFALASLGLKNILLDLLI